MRGRKLRRLTENFKSPAYIHAVHRTDIHILGGDVILRLCCAQKRAMELSVGSRIDLHVLRNPRSNRAEIQGTL
jgi:hypothetical protein